jgi:hypothetical protein
MVRDGNKKGFLLRVQADGKRADVQWRPQGPTAMSTLAFQIAKKEVELPVTSSGD